MTLKFWGPVLPFFQVKEGIIRKSLHWAYLEQEMTSIFFCYELLNARNINNYCWWAMYKNEISTFHQQSAAFCFQETHCRNAIFTMRSTYDEPYKKSVPNGLKPCKCERTKLREPPPMPYIPKKDEVQKEVMRLRNLQIKILLEKDTTLNFLVWHKNGTKEAFLMHITARSWRKPPRKVLYKCTFGAPNQGQMLDRWESQTSESALRWRTHHIMPRHIFCS